MPLSLAHLPGKLRIRIRLGGSAQRLPSVTAVHYYGFEPVMGPTRQTTGN